jgi:phage FluMu gp28-like protein
MSESRAELLARFQAIRSNPMAFLRAVRTQDQVDRIRPIKPFPVDLDYIRLYVAIWQRETRIAVPKSRRMIMTWTNVALYLWDTLFHVGRANAFVSKKEDDANELIDRAEFIYDHLDEKQIPRELLPKKSRKFGELAFPEINSKIQGFPQGADQLRQFTFSGILADEMAFWESAQEMYSAAIPTTEGGGRFTAISSASPGFFKRLVFDQLDAEDGAA